MSRPALVTPPRTSALNPIFEQHLEKIHAALAPHVGTANAAHRAYQWRGGGALTCCMTETRTVMTSGVQTMAELQQLIHDALRRQNPQWIEADGGSVRCEDYEARFALLLEMFESRRELFASGRRRMLRVTGDRSFPFTEIRRFPE